MDLPYASESSEKEKPSDVESLDSPSHIATELRSTVPLTGRARSRVVSLHKNRSTERTNSISLLTGPSRINPSAKIPGEFRTLRYAHLFHPFLYTRSGNYSIHVTDTKEGQGYTKTKDITGRLTRRPYCTLQGLTEDR